MFKPQFAPGVRDGTKLQTVRPWPARVPMPGDTLSLRMWSGLPYRSKQVVLRESIVRKTETFELTKGGWLIINGTLPTPREIEAFARADGFESAAAMIDWFKAQHGLPFENGIVIHWFPLRPEPQTEDERKTATAHALAAWAGVGES